MLVNCNLSFCRAHTPLVFSFHRRYFSRPCFLPRFTSFSLSPFLIFTRFPLVTLPFRLFPFAALPADFCFVSLFFPLLSSFPRRLPLPIAPSPLLLLSFIFLIVYFARLLVASVPLPLFRRILFSDVSFRISPTHRVTYTRNLYSTYIRSPSSFLSFLSVELFKFSFFDFETTPASFTAHFSHPYFLLILRLPPLSPFAVSVPPASILPPCRHPPPTHPTLS